MDSFYIGQYAVTNREFCEFLNDVIEGGVRNPAEGGTSWWKDTSADDLEASYNRIVPDGAGFKVKDGYAERPVIYVSWYSAAAFCNWLSKKHGMADSELCYGGYSANGLDRWGKDGSNTPDGSNYHPERKGYRLATDVEWEYACRIRKSDGTLSTDFYYWGNTLNDTQEDDYWKHIWFYGNSDSLGTTINPHIVGTRCPNGIGLYDMLGNQWEFVPDWYGTYTIPSNEFGSGFATRNLKGPKTCTAHVRRGGAWFENAAASICEIRYFCDQNCGSGTSD
ncbi:MAG: formylglycine-generating enzyme family protein [Vulcanimicrobiota bacterium]